MNKSVLVVDFDEASLHATVDLLRAQGLDVLAAASTDQLERLLTTTRPGVAIVEPSLGDADSYELCSLIQRACGERQRLILASKRLRGEALRFRAGEVGAELYFERPINDMRLVDAIVDAVHSGRPAQPATAPVARTAEPTAAPTKSDAGLELTDIDNSTFDDWIDDVFAEIEHDDGGTPVERVAEPSLADAAQEVFASPEPAPPSPQEEDDGFFGAPLDGAAELPSTNAEALAPLEAIQPPEPVAESIIEPVGAPAPTEAPTPQPVARAGTIPLAREIASRPTPKKPSAPSARKASSGATEAFAPAPTPFSPARLIFPIAALVVLLAGGWFGWRNFGAGKSEPAAPQEAMTAEATPQQASEPVAAARTKPQPAEPVATAKPKVEPQAQPVEPTPVTPEPQPIQIETKPEPTPARVETKPAPQPVEPAVRNAPKPQPAVAAEPTPSASEPEAIEAGLAPSVDLGGMLGLGDDAEPAAEIEAPQAVFEIETIEMPDTIVLPTSTTTAATVIASSRVEPKLTAAAMRRGIGGLVVLKVRVEVDGSVGAIEIVEEPANSGLGKSAGRAVKRWQYEPAMQNGRAVASDVRVEFEFEGR